jgi:hypothetical protein
MSEEAKNSAEWDQDVIIAKWSEIAQQDSCNCAHWIQINSTMPRQSQVSWLCPTHGQGSIDTRPLPAPRNEAPKPAAPQSPVYSGPALPGPGVRPTSAPRPKWLDDIPKTGV